jgi:hypothetical protein
VDDFVGSGIDGVAERSSAANRNASVPVTPYSQRASPLPRIVFSSTAIPFPVAVEIDCHSALCTQSWIATWLRSTSNVQIF